MAKIQNRRTPLWFYNELQKFFGCKFKLDAAASDRDTLCEYYYTKKENGLIQPWDDWTFCNPEFKDTTEWVCKAYHEAILRKHSIMLVPTGCTQEWFHNWAKKYTIYVPDCRLSYNLPNGKPDPGADRDTMVLAMGPRFVNLGRGEGFRMRALRVKHARPPKVPLCDRHWGVYCTR